MNSSRERPYRSIIEPLIPAERAGYVAAIAVVVLFALFSAIVFGPAM